MKYQHIPSRIQTANLRAFRIPRPHIPRPCEVLGSCDGIKNPFEGLSANTVYKKVGDELQKLVVDSANDMIGVEGKRLLEQIEAVKSTLEQIADPAEMIRKWKKTILHEAEELIIATLENETKNYEEPNIYQLAPLLKLDINNTTINIDVYLFVTKPRVDTSSRDPQWLESISFAVLKTQVKYDILQPFNIKQFEDAMKSTNFRVIDDSIKDTLTDEFKDKQKDLIINILSNHFSKYFEIFKKIQSSLSIFDF